MRISARIKNVKSGLLRFLRSPTDYKIYGISDSERFKDILVLVFLELIILIPLAMLLEGSQRLGLLDFPDHKLVEMIDEMSIHMVLFVAVFFGPILEEFVFRGFITFYRFYPLLFVIAMAGALGMNKFKLIRKIRRAWTFCFPLLMMLSVLLFGYVHVWNFEEQMSLWMIPIAISPQLIAGLFLTYARVKYGLIWSMLAHALVNFIALVLHYTIPLN